MRRSSAARETTAATGLCSQAAESAGWQTVVYTFGDAAKYSDDTRINRERWDGEVRTVPDEDIARADCIVGRSAASVSGKPEGI